MIQIVAINFNVAAKNSIKLMFQKMKFFPSEIAPKLVAENASAFFASASNKIWKAR